MNTLYANGDSFVFGMECLGDGNRSELNKDLAFAQHVARGLNCDTYINNAYNGATNEFIFRSTIFDLMAREQQGHLAKDTFVVVGWTSLHRFEISADSWLESCNPGQKTNVDASFSEYADYNTFFVSPTSNIHIPRGQNKPMASTEQDIAPFLVQYVWHDHMQVPQQTIRIIALQAWLQQHGYQYIFLNMCGDHNSDHEWGHDPNMYKLNTESFYAWAQLNYPKSIRAYNHFDAQTHEAYGAQLVKHIKEQIL